MNDRFRISSLLPVRLAEFDLPLAPLLQLAGLPPGFFRQEKIYANTAELFALYRAIGELSPDPAIGLKFGAETRFERYHPPAVVAVCSRTYRDALQRMGRYKQLTCPEDIRVSVSGDEARVEFVYFEAKEVQPEVLVDHCMSWILMVGQRGTGGRIKPLRLELMRPSRHRDLLEERFGCKVCFKADSNALVFRNQDLDLPFITHNQDLLAVIGAQLDSELEAHQAGVDLTDSVKRTLKRSLAGSRPSLQELARELGMSSRTLQRRLGEKDLTFQQLVEETRREMACHYLGQSSIDLGVVAFLLGYEEANSFFRAFQGWEGMSPGDWRERHSHQVNKAAGS